MQTIQSLQVGRAIAAISVAMFHLSITMGLPRYGGIPVFYEYTHQANIGVDFFFVLSGFIILYAHKNDIGNKLALGKYIYRRFIRIFPIYWLYTFLFVLLFIIIGGKDAHIPNNSIDWLSSLTLISFSHVSPPITPAWTLFHELAFYITFSVIIFNKKLGIIALFIFFCLTAVFFFPKQRELLPEMFFVYTSIYNLYFIFGMFAFLLYKNKNTGLLELIVGLAIILLVIAYTNTENEMIFKIPLALGMSLFLAGISNIEFKKSLRYPKFLIMIGDASYTIYLVHINIEGVLLKISNFLGLSRLIGVEVVYFFVLISTIFIGWILYFLIEQPLLVYLRNRRNKIN